MIIDHNVLTWRSDSLGIPDREHSDSEDRGLELSTRLARLGSEAGGEAREASRL